MSEIYKSPTNSRDAVVFMFSIELNAIMFQLDDINIYTCSVMPSDSTKLLVNNRGVLMLYQTFFDVCMFLCRVKLSVFIELNFYDIL